MPKIRLFRVMDRTGAGRRGLTLIEASASLAARVGTYIVEEPQMPQWDPLPTEKPKEAK